MLCLAAAIALLLHVKGDRIFPITSLTQLKFPFQISPIIWSYAVIELNARGNQHDPNYK